MKMTEQERYSGFLPPGRPKYWREKAMETLKIAVDDRYNKLLNEFYLNNTAYNLNLYWLSLILNLFVWQLLQFLWQAPVHQLINAAGVQGYFIYHNSKWSFLLYYCAILYCVVLYIVSTFFSIFNTTIIFEFPFILFIIDFYRVFWHCHVHYCMSPIKNDMNIWVILIWPTTYHLLGWECADIEYWCKASLLE